MFGKKSRWLNLFALIVIGCLVVSCASSTPEPEATEAPVEEPAEPVEEPAEEPAEEPVEEPAEPESTEPKVGGSLVWAHTFEVVSLDPHRAPTGADFMVLKFLGASLVAQDLDGKFVPYLAESWEVSEDGLTWDFYLRKDVKFTDGTPLTAQDFAWTFERALDPESRATSIVTQLGTTESAEALDDHTLRLNLSAPYAPLMYNLANSGSLQPLSKAAVEAGGDQYIYNPVGVGPYMLKEWVTGEKVVLERNPDFAWGPAFSHGGAPYIEFLEFRQIPEAATLLAALEAGEVDFANASSGVLPKDVEYLEGLGTFQVFEGLLQGWRPSLLYTVDKFPFDDVLVRRAFSMAVNREAMIQILAQGHAVDMRGVMSPSQVGYWAGGEEIGYGYDLEGAKALLAEAGWADTDDDGILDKDGQPLKFTIDALPFDFWSQVAEVTQQQFKELGVDVEILLTDPGILIDRLVVGDFVMTTMSRTDPGPDFLYYSFHSSQIAGGGNWTMVSDPEYDLLLEKTRTTVDQGERQEWLNEAQEYAIENALVIPLFAPKNFSVLSNRIEGAEYSAVSSYNYPVYLFDAYVTDAQ